MGTAFVSIRLEFEPLNRATDRTITQLTREGSSIHVARDVNAAVIGAVANDPAATRFASRVPPAAIANVWVALESRALASVEAATEVHPKISRAHYEEELVYGLQVLRVPFGPVSKSGLARFASHFNSGGYMVRQATKFVTVMGLTIEDGGVFYASAGAVGPIHEDFSEWPGLGSSVRHAARRRRSR